VDGIDWMVAVALFAGLSALFIALALLIGYRRATQRRDTPPLPPRPRIP
jgi:uncharacterized membrane protein